MMDALATYAYRCAECAHTTDLNPPMAEPTAANGTVSHEDTLTLPTRVAPTQRSSASAAAGVGCSGGGCCG